LSEEENNDDIQEEERSLPILVKDYLEAQKREIELKREENALREKEIDNQFEY